MTSSLLIIPSYVFYGTQSIAQELTLIKEALNTAIFPQPFTYVVC